jgi:hypothetical protein
MSTRVLAMVGMLALLGALGCDDDEPAPVDAGGTVEDGGGAVEDGAPMEDPRVTACGPPSSPWRRRSPIRSASGPSTTPRR